MRGLGSPAGAFGSKNPSGLGTLASNSSPRAATPASRRPAFRPTRGSGVEDGEAVCATDRHDKGRNDGRGGQHTNETHHLPSSFSIAPIRAISIA